MTALRIAHIGSKGLPSQGGTERVVEAIAIRHAINHDVTVYGRRDTCAAPSVQGVSVVPVSRSTRKYLGPVALVIRSAVHAMARSRYDVVHVHGAENAFVVPVLRMRYPVVTTNHGPAYERAKWGRIAKALMRHMERVSVRAASCATAVSRTQARALADKYGREVRYVPNGVDVCVESDLVAARELLQKAGVPGPFALFAAARVDPTKGCHTLLEAWAMAGLDREFSLVVLGDLWHVPSYEVSLREAADGLPVFFVPRIQEKPVLTGLLQLADLFVFPSLVEAMSMMLLEAVSLGVPGVASDIQENTDVLPDDYALFRAGDAVDLARTLRESLTADRTEVRQRASRHAGEISERYDWDVIAGEYERIYQLVTGRSPGL